MNRDETAHSAVRLYRFGPYEFDSRRNELRKFGIRVKLEPKPQQLLAILLDRSGEVVTRSELRQLLWAGGVFVDFDTGLRVAVTKLRAALNDRSETPKYIETVAGVGYRIIAKVEKVGTSDLVPASGRNGDTEETLPLSAPASEAFKTDGEFQVPMSLVAAGAELWTGDRSPVLPVAEPTRVSRKLQRAPAVGIVVAAALIVTALAWFLVTRPLPAPTVSNYVQVSNDARSKISSVGYVPMATDGARLYYSEISTIFRLMEVSSGGGESVAMQSVLPSVYLLDISADHTQLLVQDPTAGVLELPFWALPLVGGTLHRLGNILGHDGSWSPDGQRLAFAYQNELFLATGQGTEPRKLVTLPGIGRWIRWSPDGSKLRLTVDDTRTDSRSLWEVSADGTNLRPLLPHWSKPSDPVPGDAWPGGECCGNWTADGKYFFFQSARGGHTAIWAIREKGDLIHPKQSEAIRVTSGALNFYSPVPSLDGSKLFVVGSQPRGELQRYDDKSRQFVSFLSGISVEGLDFSRDGQWIAYVSYPEGSLWRSKVDGTERLQLTRPPMRAFLPRWAPDGSRIAFAGKLPGKTFNIYLVSAGDGTPEQLTNGEHDLADVTWSPDGERLMFGEMTGKNDRAIHVLDVMTRKASLLPGSKGLFSPRWSPNGRYVAAIPGSPQDRVVLFDFKTQRWSELAKALVGSPNWSSDSNYIYFDTGGNNPGFYRVRVSDHKPERLATLDHIRLAPVWWTGVAPDGSPLILRDVGIEEIYALDLQSR
jgi:Tol biopolymer transport system component/DNA-binding winged helix-turn-helix (wHTH) protein